MTDQTDAPAGEPDPGPASPAGPGEAAAGQGTPTSGPGAYGPPPVVGAGAYGPPPAAPPGAPPPGYGYGYGPPYAQQPGAPQPGWGVPSRTSGRATAVMVLGIVSLGMISMYCIGVVPAIVALCLAPGAKREIAASGGRVTGSGQVKAGVICSWVTVGFTVAALVVVAIFVVLGASTGWE